MKRLVLIADSDPRTTIVGGVGTYTNNLARNISKKYEVTWLARARKGKQKKVPFKVILVNKNPKQNVTFFFFNLIPYMFIKADVIHAQRPDWLALFIFNKAKKVTTLHGNHRKNVIIKQNKIYQWIYFILEWIGFKIADKVTAVDKDNYNYFKPKLKDKLVYSPVAVDTTLFVHKNKITARKKVGLSPTKKIFLFVGRLSKEKRIHEMINNLKEEEQLVIVGTGELQTELGELAKTKDILFVGSKNQKELVDYYNAANALLLFSTHEGLPTVILEALSCGTPVLSTPVGEVPNIIKNGENGYVGTKYRELMNKELTKEMKNKCIKTAKKYDWKVIAKNIEKEVYN